MCISGQPGPSTETDAAVQFVAGKAVLMHPELVYITDGSVGEEKELIGKMVEAGQIKPLKAYENK